MESKKLYNMVHNDEIWKDHIRREIFSQTKCPEQWGYLSEIYKKLQESSPQFQKSLEMSSESKDEQIEFEGKKQSFPKTSAQMIGWKASKVSMHTYGIPESRARGKCDMLRVLQWPYEGL